MTQMDYAKIDIDFSKVIINILISAYFYGLGTVLLLNHHRKFFHIHSFHDFLWPFIFFVLLCVMLVFMYNIYKRTTLTPLFIFVFLVLLFFFIQDRDILFLVSVFVVFIYAVYSLGLIVSYSRKHKYFIKKYHHMINFNKYMANFSAIFFVLLSFYIFLIVYVYYDVTLKPVKKESVYLLKLFVPMLVLFFVMAVSDGLLFGVRYVIKLCQLSSNKEVPLSEINFIFNSNLLDNDAKRWFDKNIGIYVKDVYLDERRKMIVFENSNEIESQNNEKVPATQVYTTPNYTLDAAVLKIESLLTQLVYKGTNLTNILFNMKTYLEKINILNKDKNKYNKYIYRINNRYIPYIEYLVETYLQNIELRDEKVSQLQEKIELSLTNILKVFQSMYESNVEDMKFKIENEIDAMELLIKQKGFIDDEKK